LQVCLLGNFAVGSHVCFILENGLRADAHSCQRCACSSCWVCFLLQASLLPCLAELCLSSLVCSSLSSGHRAGALCCISSGLWGGELGLFSLVCFILEDGHWADALCCHFQFKSRVSCSIGLLSLAGLACPSRMDIGLMHSVAFSMFKSRLSGSLLSYLLSSHGCRLGSCILLHFAWTLHDSACCRALHWATPQEP